MLRNSSRQMLATIGTIMIERISPATKTSLPVDDVPKSGTHPKPPWSHGSRCFAMNGPITRIPQRPRTTLGIAAALILGLGRALGEAIAVTQVIGAGSAIHTSLFETGDTLASRIAAQFQGAGSALQTSSLFYLAAILLVVGLVTNLIAQAIVRRFEFQRTGGS